SQKEKIQYELGTLMVPSFVTDDLNYKNWRNSPQYQRVAEKCKLAFPLGYPCAINVVDCTFNHYDWLSVGAFSTWQFRYDGSAADFKFFGTIHKDGDRVVMGTAEEPVSYTDIQNTESSFDNSAAKVVKRFFASRLSGRKFDMSGLRLRSNVKIKPALRIMYGEYDFFEYFEIDDAILVLEEETVSADFPKIWWTLGIAQNKHVREMMRLASNNPDLFKSILPISVRGGGVKI
ncbi:MAG: hypothetical protein AAB930_01965, partial [Patescibacteria group bacterium]